VEHVIKGPGDYAVVEYLMEHTEYLPTYDEYLAYEEQEVGDDGYPLLHAGDCPFHDWLQKWAGYGRAYFDLHDYPDKVEHLLDVMTQVHKERVWPLVAQSPARLILHGLHLSSVMTPPPMFERYILPYYQEFSALLHEHNQRLCFHADADTSLILDLIKRAGFDMGETFVTAPMVPCTLRQAREAWGSDVIIWGGVPSVILEDPVTDEEFTAYMEDLFATIAPGDAFILGVADNVMPAAKIERLVRITEMVEKWGKYPIRR
jgi:uroporphyrinogen-III decarboxylase